MQHRFLCRGKKADLSSRDGVARPELPDLIDYHNGLTRLFYVLPFLPHARYSLRLYSPFGAAADLLQTDSPTCGYGIAGKP